jgi:non-specific serine/threonine protein kinase
VPRGENRRQSVLVKEVLSPAELRGRREALGLTQSALADLLGVTSTSVARWERSEQRIGNPERVTAALARLETAAHIDPKSLPRAGSSGVPTRHNMPTPLSRLIGREEDVTNAKRLLADTRLLTITGAGGIGKTRLALQVAADAIADYTDGAWLVELAPLTDAELVGPAVSAVFGVWESPGNSVLETLADILRGRSLLLVLDNCEHLAEGCAQLALCLLKACPSLRILATSREPLRVTGETTWQIPPLRYLAGGIPASAVDVGRTAAGTLFVERAKAALPSFALTDENAMAIADVCRRLDGLPLALELAAARVSLLSVDEINARLDDRFRFLTSPNRGGPTRHRALRSAIDWSYNLLSDAEQLAFGRLSVFAGGWALEAAEAVASANKEDEADGSVIELLGQLVAKSLVVREQVGSGSRTSRYRFLETLRQYAHERLSERGELDWIRATHAEFYLRLTEEAESHLRGPRSAEWLDRLATEHENLRTALRWYAEIDDAGRFQRMLAGLWEFWYFRGYLEEGWNWISHPLATSERPRSHGVQARVQLGKSMLAYRRGDQRLSESLGRDALTFCVESGRRAEAARLRAHLGNLARMRSAFTASRSLLDQALEDARAESCRVEEVEALVHRGRLYFLHGDLSLAKADLNLAVEISTKIGYGQGVAFGLRTLGEVAYAASELPNARQLFELSLSHARQLGDKWRVAWALVPLGYVLVDNGEDERAQSMWTESLLAWRELGSLNQLAGVLEGFAYQAAHHANVERAILLVGAASAIREAQQVTILPVAQVWLNRWLRSARRGLKPAQLAELQTRSRGMDIDSAMALALCPLRSANGAKRSTPDPRLTPRETEVVELIARGATDHEIADALVITDNTAHAHVRNILTKLSLQSRVQVAAWAAAKGIRIQSS